MRTLARLRVLGGIDLRNVRRDPMLVWLTLAPLLIAVVFRCGLPPLTTTLQVRYGFELASYLPLLLSFLIVTMPAIVGAIIGFLLLDQRDDLTLTALQVTPLTLRSYLLYRAGMPMLISAVMTIVTIPLTGLTSASLVAVVLYAVLAAPLAPILALFVASFAANKVQGFALMKASGVLSWPVIIGWFIPMPWQPLMGIVPHYWIAKVVWSSEAGETSWWIFALVCLLYQAVLLALLLRRFEQVTHR